MATAPIIETTMPLKEALRLIGLDMHPEQGLVEARLEKTARTGKIGFIEAPTATGKTFAIAHHALELAVNEPETVVIAVPTIELAHQTHETIARLRDARVHPNYATIRSKVVLGRPQFVSTKDVGMLSETLGGRPGREISAWLAAGGPGRAAGYACYTRDGLLAHLAVQDIREAIPDTVLLKQGEKDPAADAYEAQFDDDGARIHVVTHAMLARDLLSRFIAASKARKGARLTVDAADFADMKFGERIEAMREEANMQRLSLEIGDEGRLPAHRRIIVDEAHLLRENVENAMSTAISITTLVAHVNALHRQGVVGATKAVAATVKRIHGRFIDIREKTAQKWLGNSMRVDWDADVEIRKLIEELHDAIDRIKTNKGGLDAMAAARARYALKQAVVHHAHVQTEVSWSPIKKFPGITVGQRGVATELGFLWGRLHSAALVSATLYTENVAGPSIDYTAGRLAVPKERRQRFEAIEAPWLVDPVTAYLPTHSAVTGLTPPGSEDGRDAWLDRVAARIDEFSTGTGTLVLNTSRATTSALVARLHIRGQGWRVIDGTVDSVTALKAVFIRMAAEDKGPIWLAQGPAWTGLDMPDDALEAVIIPRLPYPPPTTISEDSRKAREAAGVKSINYGPQVAQMAMTFKQGVGRLARIRGARPKRLIVLDGRVGKKGAGGVEQFLRRYRTVEFD